MGNSNVCEYFTIATLGNSVDFGDCVDAHVPSGLANVTRMVKGGGARYTPSNSATNIMDFITIDSIGNATDFGDLLEATQSLGGLANVTRGIFAAGNNRGTGDSYGGGRTEVMNHITIASAGNAGNFGDLTQKRQGGGGVCDGTLGIFSCADAGNNTNRVDQVSVASLGNATTWGELTVHRHHFGGQCAWNQT